MPEYMPPVDEQTTWRQQLQDERARIPEPSYTPESSFETELAEFKRNLGMAQAMLYSWGIDKTFERLHLPVDVPLNEIRKIRGARAIERGYRTTREHIKALEEELILREYRRKFPADPKDKWKIDWDLATKRQILKALKDSYGAVAKKGVPKAGLIARQGLTTVGRVSPWGLALTTADATKAFSDWEQAQEARPRHEKGGSAKGSWQHRLLHSLGLRY